MEWLFAALGLVILLLSGDMLVRGAVNVSLRLGVPALIVSLTIVAFGTSAPELLISVSAIDDGAPFETAAVMYGLREKPLELTSHVTVESIDFEQPMHDRGYEYEVELEVVQDGDLQGLVGYFDAELAPGIVLDNYPCYPGCHWVNWHWPQMPVRPVRAGETLRGLRQAPKMTVASVWRWQWR